MNELWTKFMAMTHEERMTTSRELEIEEWKSVNRFCGKCGTPMRHHKKPDEPAFVCPSCGYTAYPKISPAVIVLVTKGNQVLLQRNSHYRTSNWSLVAGFVDPGENLEEAVRREIREESSVEVKDLRYVRSQTWPFPSNIMIGFRAEYVSGELRPDGEEVLASRWFDRDALPEIPRKGTIARAMLDDWVAGRI